MSPSHVARERPRRSVGVGRCDAVGMPPPGLTKELGREDATGDGRRPLDDPRARAPSPSSLELELIRIRCRF